MGGYTAGVNSAETVKLWSRKLSIETIKKTYIKKFIGGSDSIIEEYDDLKKNAGDKVTVQLRMKIDGAGVLGDDTLEGQEVPISIYTDYIMLNQLRHAARSKGKMSEQRVLFNVREENKAALADWWAERMDLWFFTQVCGYTASSLTLAGDSAISIDTRHTGLQSAVAPDSDHYINAAAGSSDEGLGSGNLFTLAMIDKAVEKAKTLSPMIRPIKYGGDNKYVMFLHPYQVYDLRTATATGQWLDLQKAVLGNAKVDPSNNAIYTGALGEYNGVVLHEAHRVTNGVNSSTSAEITTVKRAVLCGAQSAAVAYGRSTAGFGKLSWQEEEFDYGNQLGVEAGMIAGLKKLRFNSKDFGTVVCSTYGAAH